jgi:hypothetical protein
LTKVQVTAEFVLDDPESEQLEPGVFAQRLLTPKEWAAFDLVEAIEAELDMPAAGS